jgi:glycine oxidase
LAKSIVIRGAGVAGLWSALTLARRGHDVTLVERSAEPFTDACSLYAGAMLAPHAEEEAAEELISELGLRGVQLWRKNYPDAWFGGSLIVAQPRDRRELDRFARMSDGHEMIDADKIAALEPDLAGRYSRGLFFVDEGHVQTREALAWLLEMVRKAGAKVQFGTGSVPGSPEIVVDCRGLAARDELPGLRGVRGERLLVRTKEISLSRAVRLLHPRFPIYVVPWGSGRFLIGATQIESAESGPVTVRSALELLSSAYALHPAFGEAEIIELAAGVRPAFADNLPGIIVKNDHIYINGLFRHGFLLAPVMAEMAADYIETGATHPEVFS